MNVKQKNTRASVKGAHIYGAESKDERKANADLTK